MPMRWRSRWPARWVATNRSDRSTCVTSAIGQARTCVSTTPSTSTGPSSTPSRWPRRSTTCRSTPQILSTTRASPWSQAARRPHGRCSTTPTPCPPAMAPVRHRYARPGRAAVCFTRTARRLRHRHPVDRAELTLLQYRPRRRAALRLGDHVLKVYRYERDFSDGVAGLEAARRLGSLRTAQGEAIIDDLRLTVQEWLRARPRLGGPSSRARPGGAARAPWSPA